MITTREIVKAISKKLGDMFPEAHIYTFNPNQNIQTPCFIIQPISQYNQDLLGTLSNYYLIESYLISVVFITDEPWELRYVTEIASVHLRFIELGDGHYLEPRNREIAWVDESTSNITFEIPIEVLVSRDKDPYLEEMDEIIEVDN